MYSMYDEQTLNVWCFGYEERWNVLIAGNASEHGYTEVAV